MCTVIAYRAATSVVGRNLDLERSLGERLILLPAKAPFSYRRVAQPNAAYALMGMAVTPADEPLYFDAVNERGVYMAALNFPLWASYAPSDSANGVAPFELIPYVLRQCETARQAADLLAGVTVAAIPYNEQWPLTPLHWFVCDETESFAVEPLADGLRVEPDPLDVLTNSPPLSYHRIRLSEFTGVGTDDPPSTFGGFPTAVYSRGMGGIGLPGDWSSSSRFVKAAFMRRHAPWFQEQKQAQAHMFRMLSCVSFPKGCVNVGQGEEITQYSSCVSLRERTYCYATYDDPTVRTGAFDREDMQRDTWQILV